MEQKRDFYYPWEREAKPQEKDEDLNVPKGIDFIFGAQIKEIRSGTERQPLNFRHIEVEGIKGNTYVKYERDYLPIDADGNPLGTPLDAMMCNCCGKLKRKDTFKHTENNLVCFSCFKNQETAKKLADSAGKVAVGLVILPFAIAALMLGIEPERKQIQDK